MPLGGTVRLQSFTEFWPFYLSQHSNIYCRVLHFFGTTIFFLVLLLCFLLHGWAIIIGVVSTTVITAISFQWESKRSSLPILCVGIIVLLIADWWIIFGILGAYAFAWCGHFLLEKNRPATFTYPVWSLVGDFKMWAGMCMGRYWEPDISDHWGKDSP